MKNLYTLLVISLQSSSGEEHVRDFTKSKSSMWKEELNISWDNVDIPFGEVSMSQNQKINDVWKTQRNTWKQDRKEAHSFFEVMNQVDIDALHDWILKVCDVEEFVVTSQIDG